MRFRLILILLNIVLIGSGCVPIDKTAAPGGTATILPQMTPTATPLPLATDTAIAPTQLPAATAQTPTQEGWCGHNEYPAAPLVVVNRNACLQNPQSTRENGVTQFFPEGFSVVSLERTINGYSDSYSGHAGISYSRDGYMVLLRRSNNGVIDGEWGFLSEPMTLESGCHFVKMVGNSDLTDHTGGENVFAHFVLTIPGYDGIYDLGMQNVPQTGQHTVIVPFIADRRLMIQAQVTFGIAWATVSADSTYSFELIAIVRDPSGGHCGVDSPHVR